MVVNNLDVSSDYLKKLIKDLMGECSKKLKQADTDKEKLESCFIDLGACAQVFKELLQVLFICLWGKISSLRLVL